MAQVSPSFPSSPSQNEVACLADTVTRDDEHPQARQTRPPSVTTRDPERTYTLNVDAPAFVRGHHEHVTEEQRLKWNPRAPDFAPGTPWRTTSTYQHSFLSADATGFTPGTQSHICSTVPSKMSALAPEFVPESGLSTAGHSHRLTPPPGLSLEDGTAMRVILSTSRAEGWTPNASVAAFVPGAQQWAPYTYSDPTPEVRYKSRLNRVQYLNDELGVPENYPPFASVVSTKVWNPRTKRYEGHYEESCDCVEQYLHHIDFFGRVVYTKSATDPATTLAVFKASGKWLYMGSEFKSRNHFLVTSAARYLDPVVYYGKPDVLDELHGTALENACIGQCAKFYSRNGRWRHDYYGADEERPILDTMDPEDYDEGHIIVNGCTPGFATREQVLAAGTEEQVAIDAARQAAWQSRKARGPVKSRLADCSTSEESPVVCIRKYSMGRTPNVNDRAMEGQSAVERDSPSDIAPAQGSTQAPSTSAGTSMSSEEFNKRCEAIMPSLSDWSQDEEETETIATETHEFPSALAAQSVPGSGAEVGAAPSREEWNRRLEAAAPLRPLSSSWADDIDDEEAEEEDHLSTPTEPQGCLTPSEALHQRLEAAAPLRPLSSSWADDVEDEEDEQANEVSTSTQLQGCLTQSEALHKQLEAIGSLSTNASWADDIDDDEEEVIVPQTKFTPPVPLATIVEETCEELNPLDSEAEAITGAEDVPSTSEPSTSDGGISRTTSISVDSEGTPPTSNGESNEDQVDVAVHHDDDNDNIYETGGATCTHDDIPSAENVVRSDDDIFGMSLEEEYQNIHGVPMPIEISEGADDMEEETVPTPAQPHAVESSVSDAPAESPGAHVASATEVVDTEEDIIGNVIHPNDTLRDVVVDNIAPGAIVNDVSPELNPQESAPAGMPAAASPTPVAVAISDSQAHTPRRQILYGREPFPEQPRLYSLASTPSPSPSLTGFDHYWADFQTSPAVSSYDQWPDFSAVHYYSPSSLEPHRSFNHNDGALRPISASSTLKAIQTGRRRDGWNVVRLFSSTTTMTQVTVAGVTSSETSEDRQKSWFKKSLVKLKGFFSKKN